jgi:hypothetical protein
MRNSRRRICPIRRRVTMDIEGQAVGASLPAAPIKEKTMTSKILVIAAMAGSLMAGGLMVSSAWAAPAQDAQTMPARDAQTAPAPKSGNICLRTIDIQNTTIPDEKTILFHMRNGKIWKNSLRNRCNGLRFNGFAYVATPPNQICGNLQTIRAIQTGSVCMLGAFTPYEAPKKAPVVDEAPPPAE